jgi:hypothetical protein
MIVMPMNGAGVAAHRDVRKGVLLLLFGDSAMAAEVIDMRLLYLHPRYR